MLQVNLQNDQYPHCLITSFHFFSTMDKAILLSMGKSSIYTQDPKASNTLKALLLQLFPHFLVSSICPSPLNCSQACYVAQYLPSLKDGTLKELTPSYGHSPEQTFKEFFQSYLQFQLVTFLLFLMFLI